MDILDRETDPGSSKQFKPISPLEAERMDAEPGRRGSSELSSPRKGQACFFHADMSELKRPRLSTTASGVSLEPYTAFGAFKSPLRLDDPNAVKPLLDVVPSKNAFICDPMWRVDAETVARLLNGHASVDKVGNNFDIVDCRNEYEYKGGHITGAISCPTLDQALEALFEDNDMRPSDRCIILHCEFSEMRAPMRYQELCTYDQQLAAASFDEDITGFYPQMYVLDGGYCQFHRRFPQLCQGGYVPCSEEDNDAFLRTSRSGSVTFRKHPDPDSLSYLGRSSSRGSRPASRRASRITTPKFSADFERALTFNLV
ncbi:M-phase inducer phosphatase [Carpediemonas membranifera]|uniref:protein-tyrosine-phosphatase n=1 Tax=Carpediemonas membranifera TaxID=201153 RepID=A0A8J6E9D0_9EUKA|nr:M-phase inducer phosphatase [Carpediemonas membranifera]|eukprot:KAG9393160.1 M-phase inducer phosphatase [Carpediemonas membranifera]